METDPTFLQAFTLIAREALELCSTVAWLDVLAVAGVWIAAIATFLAAYIALNKEGILRGKQGPLLDVLGMEKSAFGMDISTKLFIIDNFVILVRNEKGRETARNAVVFVEYVKLNGEDRDIRGPDRLLWQGPTDLPVVDIYSGMTCRSQLLQLRWNSSEYLTGFELGTGKTGEGKIIRSYFKDGTYLIGLLVAADNAPARRFLLTFTKSESDIEMIEIKMVRE